MHVQTIDASQNMYLSLYVKLNDILLRWNDVSFIFNKTTHTAASIPIVFL